MKLFEEFKIKDMTVKNRIVMPPMCMYSAADDGLATAFHLNHYTTRALGGVGLIIVESTAVNPEGRISVKDLGIWDDGHIDGLKKIVDACHENGSKIALQLNYAGRRSTASVKLYAPSALRYDSSYPTPEELTAVKLKSIIADFKAAAARAKAAGFDALEIHAAHGYLTHEFLSPLTNKRTDEYGGSTENRVRFLKEVIETVKAVWPAEKPLWMRVSAYDYDRDGIDGDMMVEYVNMVKSLIDLVHVSTGGVTPVKINDFPGYQVPFAEKIKKECIIPTIAVGLITTDEMAEEILRNGRADMVAFGRELLRDPYWPVHAAVKNGVADYAPEPYKRAFY